MTTDTKVSFLAEDLFTHTHLFAAPQLLDGGTVSVERPEENLLIIRNGGSELARIQQGMLHEAIAVFSDSPAARQVLTDNHIDTETIDLQETYGYEHIPPMAMWFRRARAYWSDSKPITHFTHLDHDSDEIFHAIYQMRLDGDD